MRTPLPPLARWLAPLCLTFIPLGAAAAVPGAGETVPFNDGWLFHRGDVAGAEAPAFNAAAWRRLDLPHDWSIELPDNLAPGEGLRDPKLPRGADVGYLRGGIGWYRKTFSLANLAAGERVEVQFDGVQQEAEVWLNGHFLTLQPHGYAPFALDLTPHLNRSGDNVLAVRATNPGENTRWYAGSGVYRDVHLRRMGPVHVPTGGVRIDTFRLTEGGGAIMQVRAELANDLAEPRACAVELVVSAPGMEALVFPAGSLRLAPKSVLQPSFDFTLEKARLWSPDDPFRYTLELRLREGDTVLAASRHTFGVRTVEVSAEKGFLLNGKPVELAGGCVHHDNGLIGAVSYLDAERRRVRSLKASGFNAIRTSHNPPSAALLEACDELGLLVIDEFCDSWEMAKRPNGYQRYFATHWEKDLRAFVRRDYNRPCVVLWSIGNEISERARPEGVEWSRRLVGCIRELDTRRPITNGICGLWDNPDLPEPWFSNAPAYRHLDVVGNNYYSENYEKDHARHPGLIIVGTESYATQAFINWRKVEALPYVIGDFVWTAMDHIGESGIGHATFESTLEGKESSVWQLRPFPEWVNGSGDLDLIADKKAQSHYRDVVWRLRPLAVLVQDAMPAGTTELVGAWGWTQEQPIWPSTSTAPTRRVNVYTRGDRAVLRLNGALIGEAKVNPDTLTATFQVAFAPGKLEAEAFAAERSLGKVLLESAGPAAALAAAPEPLVGTATRDRLLYVPISVVDAEGRLQTAGELSLQATVSGPAELLAFGSANPTYLGSLQAPETKTYRGRAMLILRPTGTPGKVTVKLTSPGLLATEVTF
ncbi:glycoside hydrolase family 2 TIM barrel-domain containing protein [Nibricoccus sp. IMCC34717]|uniref:glycoside hydrolase family 2 TIM barrel-domain containing protein n=1 Tax=Nibricoccus sp. IMCC34717 TaxID=3034021 RepID=UPI00384B30E6